MPVELVVEKMVYGGDALCRGTNNTPVFVPFCLPGERILAELTRTNKTVAFGRLVEVLEKSPERKKPRCRHFQDCGGCHYQGLPYPLQIAIKESILRDQLIRLGKIQDPPVLPMIPAEEEWNYRSVVQLHVTANGQMGFQKPSSHTIVPISECFLPTAEIMDLIPNLIIADLPGEDRLEIRAGSDRSLMIVIHSLKPDLPEIECELPLSIVHLHQGSPVILSGIGTSTYEVDGQNFQVSAGSFFQVNLLQAARMVELLLEKIRGQRYGTIMDLYSGVGLFSKFLAPFCDRLIAIESSPSACKDFRINLQAWDNCELLCGTVEDVLPRIGLKTELVVIDPPRTGIDRRAITSLLKALPDAVAYVSCNPSTLARDLAQLLSAGYTLEKIIPVDMFPQTYHIESVSFLQRA